MKPTLKNRLHAYLKSHPGWHAKGNLADMARDSNLHATGEATGRRLRELQEDGIIQVEYRGKHHAFYRLSTEEPVEELVARTRAWFEGILAK